MILLNSSKTLPRILGEEWICKLDSTILGRSMFCNSIKPVETELDLAFKNLTHLINIPNQERHFWQYTRWKYALDSFTIPSPTVLYHQSKCFVLCEVRTVRTIHSVQSQYNYFSFLTPRLVSLPDNISVQRMYNLWNSIRLIDPVHSIMWCNNKSANEHQAIN
jgi:hypothetical protein